MTFAEYVEQKQMAFAKPKLRKAQFDCALGGNATMLIWLGKQYLGQMEKQEINFTGDMSADVSAKIEEIKAKYNDKK